MKYSLKDRFIKEQNNIKRMVVNRDIKGYDNWDIMYKLYPSLLHLF
jgi:hypothetical protein